MPWFDDIDPIRPADTEFVSEGAMRFREMKRALIERLSTAYSGFPGENPDRAGELLLFPIVSVMVGAEAERPVTPVREGHGWFSTDTGRLWIGTQDLEWQQVIDDGGPGTTEGFYYQPDELTRAERLGLPIIVGRVIPVTISGTTNAIGTIGVTLTDFNPNYDSTNVISVVANHGTPGSPNYTIKSDTASSDPPEDNWAFRVFDAAGAAVALTPLIINAVFYLEVVDEEVVYP